MASEPNLPDSLTSTLPMTQQTSNEAEEVRNRANENHCQVLIRIQKLELEDDISTIKSLYETECSRFKEYWNLVKENPQCNTYNPDHWDIVPFPICANGTPRDEVTFYKHGKDVPHIRLAWPGCQLKSFSKFPCLPVELRLKIWKLALPDPRVVHVQSINFGEALSDIRLNHGMQFVTQLQSTCREAAYVFHEHYQRMKLVYNIECANFELPYRVNTEMPLDYIDVKRDTLVIGVLLINKLVDHHDSFLDISRIENLAIEELDFLDDGVPSYQRVETLPAFLKFFCPNLRDLTLISKQNSHEHSANEYLDLVEIDTERRRLKLNYQQEATIDGEHLMVAVMSTSFIDPSKRLKKDLLELAQKDPSFWAKVNIKVAAVCIRRETPVWAGGIVFLAPKTKQPFNACYYAERPNADECFSRRFFPTTIRDGVYPLVWPWPQNGVRWFDIDPY